MLTLSPKEAAHIAISGYGAMQKPEEFSSLIALVDSISPKVILEIGVGRGGTSWAWSKISSLTHLICLDLPSGPWGGTDPSSSLQYTANNSKATLTYISGNSQSSEALETVRKTLDGRGVDFLFIDGDHSEKGVKCDFLTYSPLVNRPGLIAFHDILPHPPETLCEVDKFWAEIKSSGIPEDQYSEFLQEPLSWGGIGAVKW